MSREGSEAEGSFSTFAAFASFARHFEPVAERAIHAYIYGAVKKLRKRKGE
jgi:hypothetical protein